MDNSHQRAPRLVKGHKGKGKRDNSLKVVYISTPMKVRTSASRFRSLVQQLTGKNSDVARYMEDNTTRPNDFHEIECDGDDGVLAKEVSETQALSSISSPATSDSLSGPIDNNVFTSQIAEEFAGIFCFDHSQLDVLGNYDELL